MIKMTNITSWIKAAGASVLLIAIVVIILGKFSNISYGGGTNGSVAGTANYTLQGGITLIDSLLDYVEIAVLIIIGIWFFTSISKKGGMSQ